MGYVSMYGPIGCGLLAVLVRNRISIWARVWSLGSGPHTPPKFSGSTFLGTAIAETNIVDLYSRADVFENVY